jgi:hypothetical protein
MGVVAPIGGAAFITGWLCLALAARRARRLRGLRPICWMQASTSRWWPK